MQVLKCENVFRMKKNFKFVEGCSVFKPSFPFMPNLLIMETFRQPLTFLEIC